MIVCHLQVQCLAFFFSVPFDEDERDPNVWFLDHDYLENMYTMFKKVNGEWLRGWKFALLWTSIPPKLMKLSPHIMHVISHFTISSLQPHFAKIETSTVGFNQLHINWWISATNNIWLKSSLWVNAYWYPKHQRAMLLQVVGGWCNQKPMLEITWRPQQIIVLLWHFV